MEVSRYWRSALDNYMTNTGASVAASSTETNIGQLFYRNMCIACGLPIGLAVNNPGRKLAYSVVLLNTILYKGFENRNNFGINKAPVVNGEEYGRSAVEIGYDLFKDASLEDLVMFGICGITSSAQCLTVADRIFKVCHWYDRGYIADAIVESVKAGKMDANGEFLANVLVCISDGVLLKTVMDKLEACKRDDYVHVALTNLRVRQNFPEIAKVYLSKVSAVAQ